MTELPAQVDKELLHLETWFGDVDSLVGRGREAFLADPLLQHAADGLLAKIGEASVRLRDAGWTAGRPSVPWRQVIGNRNRPRQWTTLEVSVRQLPDALRVDISQASEQSGRSGGPAADDEAAWDPPVEAEPSP